MEGRLSVDNGFEGGEHNLQNVKTAADLRDEGIFHRFLFHKIQSVL